MVYGFLRRGTTKGPRKIRRKISNQIASLMDLIKPLLPSLQRYRRQPTRRQRFGSIVVAPRYPFCSNFSEGLAAVREGVLKGFIDTDGKMVIRPRFGITTQFRDGICLVAEHDSIGYIDRTGDYVWRGPSVECRME